MSVRIAPQLHLECFHSKRVKSLILSEFCSGDRRVQSRNDPKKALLVGVFPILDWCEPLVQTRVAALGGYAPWCESEPGLIGFLPYQALDLGHDLAEVGLISRSQPIFRTDVLVVRVGGYFWMVWSVIVTKD